MRGWMLVAGATGLVGSALTAAAAARGTGLVLVGRSGDALAEAAERLAAGHGVPVLPLAVDLTVPTAVTAAVGGLADLGVDRLDSLAHLVTGYQGVPVTAADLPAEEFRRLLDTDVTTAFTLVRACLPLLRRAPAARVVLLSSVAGLRGRPMAAHLCAAKAAVHGLTLGLAAELGGEGIGVNTVAPGPIARPGVPHPPTPIPLTTPERVAEAVLRLSGPDCREQGTTTVVTGEPAPDPGLHPGLQPGRRPGPEPKSPPEAAATTATMEVA